MSSAAQHSPPHLMNVSLYKVKVDCEASYPNNYSRPLIPDGIRHTFERS